MFRVNGCCSRIAEISEAVRTVVVVEQDAARKQTAIRSTDFIRPAAITARLDVGS
jgi:hypothetical protein